MTEQEAPPTSEAVPDREVYLRLAQAIEELGINQRQLAKEAGIREAAVSQGVNHQTGLDQHWRALSFALEQHGIDTRWLLHGHGNMRIGDNHTPGQAFPALTQASSAEVLREIGTVTEQASYAEPMSVRFKSIPGEGVVLVQDGSMDPLIRAGQWAMLAPVTRIPRDGEIALVKTHDGEAYVRRYRLQDGSVILEHINPDRRYRTVVLSRSDVQEARVVVGVVFE